MNAPALREHKGPWTHRLLVGLFSLLFGLLMYWLLGFVVRDIGTWPGPNYDEVQREILDAALIQELENLRLQIEETNRAIADSQQRQAVLRDSTANSERTMNQLLELQRLTLQKGMASSPEELQALAESQKLFLANQTRYQEINDQIAALSEQLRELESRQRNAQRQVDRQRDPIQREFQARYSRHQWKLAAFKLAVLVPLLAAAGWLFLKKRGGLYAPLIYGFGLAVLIKVGMVIQEHFPRRYFKYVLIGFAILVVARVLVYLLRMRAYPKPDWLLKQYREAYEHFLCPACNYPIRRGPLRYLFWTRRTLRRLRIPVSADPQVDEPYTCPACGTVLFEECPSCHAVRHALLPVCAKCGDARGIDALSLKPAGKS
jgi:predicted RNA-binding Zn-ribbon protein involved in translation (DUF1610 family)